MLPFLHGGFVNRCKSVKTQTQLALLGNVVRELAVHPLQEIAACETLAQAIYRAMMHSGDTQESVAARVNVSASYLSLILTGKRICPARLVVDIARETKSAAPLQWMAAQIGAEVYVDELAAKEARLARELRQVQAERAA